MGQKSLFVPSAVEPGAIQETHPLETNERAQIVEARHFYSGPTNKPQANAVVPSVMGWAVSRKFDPFGAVQIPMCSTHSFHAFAVDGGAVSGNKNGSHQPPSVDKHTAGKMCVRLCEEYILPCWLRLPDSIKTLAAAGWWIPETKHETDHKTSFFFRIIIMRVTARYVVVCLIWVK